jgi:subtilase family serine protease
VEPLFRFQKENCVFDRKSLNDAARDHLPLSVRQRSHLILEVLEGRNLMSVLTPIQVRHAYGFDQINFTNSSGQKVLADGTGQTIAIVDAYDDPTIANDLHVFDQKYGLADPKFIKATPQGTPSVDANWSLEISLDVEWAHAIAPNATILLVEAKSASFSDLLGAVAYADSQSGVSVVSMSWGALESSFSASSELALDSTFKTPAGHSGVTFVASSGDDGGAHGPSWPSISPNVLAVGGTSLTLADSLGTYGKETGWSGSGGGVSKFEKKPAYQVGFQTTGYRTAPDVAYDGDPNTGFAVYDGTSLNGQTGWFQVGGTSAGAPQWAALIAIADQGRALAGKGALDGPSQTLPAIYQFSASDFHDITSGSNRAGRAGSGYDQVTGRGSPVANLVIRDFVAYAKSGTTFAFTSVGGAGLSYALSHEDSGSNSNAPGSTIGLFGGILAQALSTRDEAQHPFAPSLTEPCPSASLTQVLQALDPASLRTNAAEGPGDQAFAPAPLSESWLVYGYSDQSVVNLTGLERGDTAMLFLR